MEGRLLKFYAVPPQLEPESASPAPAPDWTPLFAEARLDPASFRAVAPRWTPSFYVDARAAWEGSWPGRPDIPVRIEAAAHRGRPAWFEIVWPWSRPERMETQSWPTDKILRQALFLTVVVLLLGAAAFMARRNLVLGRGDRRGAFRVSLLLCGVGIVSWALGAHNVADWNAQTGLVFRGAGAVVLEAAFVWLVYLAVEPYARRLRPWTLVSWTRFLGGGFSDPVVGRDMLAGVAWAVLVYYLNALRYVVPPLFGQAPPEPSYSYLDALLGAGPLLGGAQLGERVHPFRAGRAAAVRAAAHRCCGATRSRSLALACPADAERARRGRVGLVHGADLDRGDGHLDPAAAALRAARGVGRGVRLRGAVRVPDHDRPASWKAGPTLLALPLLALLCRRAFRNASAAPGCAATSRPSPARAPEARAAAAGYHRRDARRHTPRRPSPTARRAPRPTTRTFPWVSSCRASGGRTSTRSTPSPAPPTISRTSRSTRACAQQKLEQWEALRPRRLPRRGRRADLRGARRDGAPARHPEAAAARPALGLQPGHGEGAATRPGTSSLDYCRRSANPVGRLVLHVFEREDDPALRAALGRASAPRCSSPTTGRTRRSTTPAGASTCPRSCSGGTASRASTSRPAA